MIAHKKVSIPYSVPVSSTPFKSTLASPNCSLGSLISPARGERTPFLHNSSSNQNKPQRRGLGVKRVLTNYLGAELKAKISGNPTEDSCTIPTNGTEDKENQNNLSAHPNDTKTRQSQPRYMVTWDSQFTTLFFFQGRNERRLWESGLSMIEFIVVIRTHVLYEFKFHTFAKPPWLSGWLLTVHFCVACVLYLNVIDTGFYGCNKIVTSSGSSVWPCIWMQKNVRKLQNNKW